MNKWEHWLPKRYEYEFIRIIGNNLTLVRSLFETMPHTSWYQQYIRVDVWHVLSLQFLFLHLTRKIRAPILHFIVLLSKSLSLQVLHDINPKREIGIKLVIWIVLGFIDFVPKSKRHSFRSWHESENWKLTLPSKNSRLRCVRIEHTKHTVVL